ASEYLDIFKGDFYIELQRSPSSKVPCSYNNISEVVASFAVPNGLPLVATNNVRYIDMDSYDTYRHLFKLKSMSAKNDPLARIIMGRENYFKSAEQMALMFHDIPDAISNTAIISDRCSLDLGPKRTYLPHFKVPGGETEAICLRRLCLMGLGWRSGHYPPPEYVPRLEKELSVIEKTGFSGYFLIIADIARFTRTKNIPICGKGSAAGSLVSYLLGISNVDPIKHDLYFERFLNSERKNPPDVDIDICSKRRGEVLNYLSSKYGRESVSRVCSFSSLRPRAAIREAGRIMGLGKYDIDNITRKAGSFRSFPSRRSLSKNRKEIKQCIAGDRLSRSVLSIAGKIENYIRHLSMHPSAFIISCGDLAGMVPLTISETGETMTQYDMDSIEELGLIKIDLIGSISLSLISDVIESLKKRRNIDIDLSKINYDDEKVFDIIKNGRTHGVFQLESSGIRSLAKKLKPSSLNDITLLISLYRPGPQQSGMVENFIERKFGREDITFIHKDLEPILRDTYGVILYQEQVMKIALKIANYSLSEADVLRKAITRLSSSEMEKQKSKFIKGSFQNGYPSDIAISIFGLISKFASYGFVKAHAAAYSEISYKIAYLKVYFPAELISAILSNNSGYYGQAQYIEEARRLGLTLRLPDINKSGLYFTPEDHGKSIRIPLTSIRDLGFSGADSIIKERAESGPFKDLIDFYSRCRRNCPLNKNAIENLIRIGGFDFTGL
ncbi:MAG TPA: DNA polymerase III subunit alpha, partial [Actinobacteria bacterium]|nr:DNA polymerase III subunit alpha [Actinomycetota bacterium]